MFQISKILVALLFAGFLLADAVNGQVVHYDHVTSYSAPTTYYSTPTYTTPTQTYYSSPTYSAPTQTHYSTPTYTEVPTQTHSSTPVTTSYYGQAATPVYYNNRNVRFRDQYTQYSPWYNVAQPTYADYNYNRRFDGPNETYARSFNNANGLSYRNGLRAGLSRMSVSQARERDDVLRARAFTEARGLTWDNGLIRGYIGASIRSSARD